MAILLKIPWDRANERLPLKLTLVSEDGEPVVLEEQGKVEHSAGYEVGRPPGLPHGSLIDSALAIPVPPLPLKQGRYQWRFEISTDIVTVSFDVR